MFKSKVVIKNFEIAILIVLGTASFSHGTEELSNAINQAQNLIAHFNETRTETPKILPLSISAHPRYSLAQWQSCDIKRLKLNWFNLNIRKNTRVERFPDPNGGGWTFIFHDWKRFRFPEPGDSGTAVYLCAMNYPISTISPASGLKIHVTSSPKGQQLVLDKGNRTLYIHATDLIKAIAQLERHDDYMIDSDIAWMMHDNSWPLMELRLNPADAPIEDVFEAAYQNIKDKSSLANSWIHDVKMRRAAIRWISQNLSLKGTEEIMIRLSPEGDYQAHTIQIRSANLSLVELKKLSR